MCKKGIYENFVKFMGEHLCQRFFFNKVASKNGTLAQMFYFVNFAKFLRIPFLTSLLAASPRSNNSCRSSQTCANLIQNLVPPTS